MRSPNCSNNITSVYSIKSIYINFENANFLRKYICCSKCPYSKYAFQDQGYFHDGHSSIIECLVIGFWHSAMLDEHNLKENISSDETNKRNENNRW